MQAKEALRSRPAWNVVLIDANRQQLVNTRLPLGRACPSATPARPVIADRRVETQEPYVSDLFQGTVASG